MELNLQFALIIAFIIVLIYLCYQHCSSESFANVEEKATQLTQWVNQHPRGKYVEFIQDNPESNIVEYTKLRDLSARTGHATTRSAISMLKL